MDGKKLFDLPHGQDFYGAVCLSSGIHAVELAKPDDRSMVTKCSFHVYGDFHVAFSVSTHRDRVSMTGYHTGKVPPYDYKFTRQSPARCEDLYLDTDANIYRLEEYTREKGDIRVFGGSQAREGKYSGSLDSVICLGQSCYILRNGILYGCDSGGAVLPDSAAAPFLPDSSYDPLRSP